MVKDGVAKGQFYHPFLEKKTTIHNMVFYNKKLF
jgi:hypothetical protein